MNNESGMLSNNTLALMALCNEFCAAVENASATQTIDFVDSMLRILPRIYIAVTDVQADFGIGEGGYIAPSLDEDTYDRLRQTIAAVMGEDDTFLEVSVEDMKYSDTPIAATVSESLADMFQVFYDFLETCRDAPNDLINEAVVCIRESFADYWSQTLTNVLRALNAVKYN